MANIFCPKCGTPTVDSIPFCGNCGANLQGKVFEQTIAPRVPVRTPPVHPAPKKKRSAGIVILSVFLSILLVIFSSLAMMIAGVRNMMSAKTVERIAHNVICSDAFLDVPAFHMVEIEDKKISVMEYLMQSMFLVGGQDYDFNEADFRAYLEESQLIDLFCNELGKLIQDVRDNTNYSGISTDELFNALYADETLIEERLYLRLSHDDISYIVYNLEESGLTALFTHDEGNSIALDVLESLISRGNMIVLLVLAVVCLLIIAFVSKLDWKFLCIDLGISFMLAGGIACLPALLDGVIRSVLSLPLAFLPVVTKIMDMMTIQLILPGLVEMAAGVVLIVVFIIIHSRKKKTA